MKKNNLLFILLFTFYNISNAQNAYVHLSDVSGFNNSYYQNELESISLALRAVFPDSLQNQFKVFDFGFYIQQGKYVGGCPAVFEQKKQEVSALSPYYLLFGKETDHSGIYQHFWVDIKLPSSGDFGCFDLLSPTYRSAISAKHQMIANDLNESFNFDPYMYHKVEIETMDSLRAFLLDAFECCGLVNRGGTGCTPCLVKPTDIIFSEASDQLYGFDDFFGLNMFSKSIEIGHSDNVEVSILPAQGDVYKQIYFYPEGPSYFTLSPNILGANKSPITISATQKNKKGEGAIQAKCVDTNGEILNKNDDPNNLSPYNIAIYSYPLKEIKFAIRVVNETNFKCTTCTINKDDLQLYLKKVFRSAVVDVKLEVLDEMTVGYDLPDDFGNKDGLFNPGESTISEEQHFIIRDVTM
jgi:hypothetical protein